MPPPLLLLLLLFVLLQLLLLLLEGRLVVAAVTDELRGNNRRVSGDSFSCLSGDVIAGCPFPSCDSGEVKGTAGDGTPTDAAPGGGLPLDCRKGRHAVSFVTAPVACLLGVSTVRSAARGVLRLRCVTPPPTASTVESGDLLGG